MLHPTAATPANRAPHRQIDATGTRRRLQALIAAGWPLDDLARRLQRTVSNMHRTMAARTVTARTAQHIADLHEQLWNIAAPHATEAERAASTAARNHAARHGWLPTLAWDDIDTTPTRPPCAHPPFRRISTRSRSNARSPATASAWPTSPRPSKPKPSDF